MSFVDLEAEPWNSKMKKKYTYKNVRIRIDVNPACKFLICDFSLSEPELFSDLDPATALVPPPVNCS
jgi:hypothetical protein